jgi:hypothetical protein
MLAKANASTAVRHAFRICPWWDGATGGFRNRQNLGLIEKLGERTS